MYWRKRSIFPRKAIKTKAAKIRILNGLRVLDARLAKEGYFLAVKIPSSNGIPKIKATVTNTLQKSISISRSSSDVGPYKLAQIAKFKGVATTEIELENAVKLTERAVLPFARLLRKFETFPPGQDATRNIPKATDGGGEINNTRPSVRSGKRKNWERIPRKKPLGFLTKYWKSSTFRPNATPYIIRAKARFKSKRSSCEKFNLIPSKSMSPDFWGD